jgi:ubiquinone/menaquinone biosynthesis C-methylase UbiE/uncharacterized protein YbaR (Trm112 family)
MHSAIVRIMRCPRCGGSSLEAEAAGVSCGACASVYPIRDGVLDVLGDDIAEVITPFQRIMQNPLVVSIYESVWRKLGYFLASSRPFQKELSTILSLHLDKNSARVLDLACGPGVFTRPLARQSSGIVVGVDLSLPMLRHAGKVLRRSSLRNVVLVRGSAFRLPFAEGVFTYVNCCGALHLFDDPDRALAEIRRVLTPGGFMSVQTTLRPARSAGIALILERFIRFGFFEEQLLEQMLQKHGFRRTTGERHRISYTFLCR